MRLDSESASVVVASAIARGCSVKEAFGSLQSKFVEQLQSDGSSYVDVFSGLNSPVEGQGSVVRCRGMIQEVQSELTVMKGSLEKFFSPDSDVGGIYVETAVVKVVPVPGNQWMYATKECIGRVGGFDESESQGAACRSLVRQHVGDSCVVTIPSPSSHASSKGTRSQPFHMNDVWDFYGFLEPMEPIGEASALPSGFDDFFPREATTSNPRIRSPETDGSVQCLLAFASVPISSGDGLGSWLHREMYVPLHPSAREPLTSITVEWFEAQRSFALQWMRSQMCYGNELLAEYLLLHLCSQVLDHPTSTPIGDAPLLVRYDATQCFNLYEEWLSVIQHVALISAVGLNRSLIDATVSDQVGRKRSCRRDETLALCPRHDVEQDCVLPGLLPIANGTNLVVDLRLLGNDALWSDHKSSIYNSLFSIVHQCCVPIHFPYHKVELPVSVATLVLCPLDATVPDMLDFPLSVNCVPSKEEPESHPDIEAAFPSVSNYTVDDLRRFLCAVRRRASANFQQREDHFSPLVQEHLELLLLTLAGELHGWNNQHSLIHNNTLSVITSLVGIHAASRGQSGITITDIDYVAALERRRHRSCRA